MDCGEPEYVKPLGELTWFDAVKDGDKDKLDGIDAPESSRNFGSRLSKTNPLQRTYPFKGGAGRC